MVDGQAISAILIGIASLIAYLVSQSSTKGRALRREVRDLRRRDIASMRWRHKVDLEYASRGEKAPALPRELLSTSEDDEKW